MWLLFLALLLGLFVGAPSGASGATPSLSGERSAVVGSCSSSKERKAPTSIATDERETSVATGTGCQPIDLEPVGSSATLQRSRLVCAPDRAAIGSPSVLRSRPLRC